MIVPKRDLRYLEEGTYIIINRPRSLGESTYVIVYSKNYRRIWRYWITNPDNLPEPDGWLLVQRVAGCNKVIKNPIPPDRLHKLGHLVAAVALVALCSHSGHLLSVGHFIQGMSHHLQ
jgi:hypothetical protein